MQRQAGARQSAAQDEPAPLPAKGPDAKAGPARRPGHWPPAHTPAPAQPVTGGTWQRLLTPKARPRRLAEPGRLPRTGGRPSAPPCAHAGQPGRGCQVSVIAPPPRPYLARDGRKENRAGRGLAAPRRGALPALGAHPEAHRRPGSRDRPSRTAQLRHSAPAAEPARRGPDLPAGSVCPWHRSWQCPRSDWVTYGQPGRSFLSLSARRCQPAAVPCL